jgi:hypothetical protein
MLDGFVELFSADSRPESARGVGRGARYSAQGAASRRGRDTGSSCRHIGPRYNRSTSFGYLRLAMAGRGVYQRCSTWRLVRRRPVTRRRLAGLELVQSIACRPLYGLPRAPRPRGTGMRGQRVLETTREEDRAPAPPVVASELEVVLLAGHPCPRCRRSRANYRNSRATAQFGLTGREARPEQGKSSAECAALISARRVWCSKRSFSIRGPPRCCSAGRALLIDTESARPTCCRQPASVRFATVAQRGMGPLRSHTPVTPRRSTIGRLCEIFQPSFVRLKSVRYSPVIVTDAAPVVSLVDTPSHAAVIVAVSPSTLISLLVTM